MLERPSAWPHFRHLREDPSALEEALRAFSRAQGGPEKRMPLIAELEAAGREDLIKVIHAAGECSFLHNWLAAPRLKARSPRRGLQHAGGSHAVAAALGWRTQRRQRHSSAGLQAAAELVREYLAGLPAGERESMPVHRKLMARGRHDIRYALQVMGSFFMVDDSMTACGQKLTIRCMTSLGHTEKSDACYLAWEFHGSRLTDYMTCTALELGPGQLGMRQ